MERLASLAAGLPAVCRLGLATRGTSKLKPDDVEFAIRRGVNYLNWCGKPDGMSRAIAGLGKQREDVVVAVQFEARSAADAAREIESMLRELGTDWLDIATLYYVESQGEWDEILAPGGAWEYLAQQKQEGRLRMIGLTSHQRKLAAEWAESGRLDLLMIRYNAAHRGAERDVFPVTTVPVVTFTGLRWKALLASTPDDPESFAPPAAVEWYRFCLTEPRVSVALAAPANRSELEEDLALLNDWREPSPDDFRSLRSHGDRVRRHAGTFW